MRIRTVNRKVVAAVMVAAEFAFLLGPAPKAFASTYIAICRESQGNGAYALYATYHNDSSSTQTMGMNAGGKINTTSVLSHANGYGSLTNVPSYYQVSVKYTTIQSPAWVSPVTVSVLPLCN